MAQQTPPITLFIALFATLFSVIFNFTLSMMASPYITGDLGGSNDIATYTVSFFALGNALSIPLGKYFIARIGARRLLTIALLLFTLFSLACATSGTYFLFNACRFLQGFSSGPIYAIGFYLFSSLQPKEKKGLFSSITLMIFTVTPVIGACWGGWIAYEWHWSWPFYGNIPPLLFLAWYLRRQLKNFAEEQAAPSFDAIGYSSYFISIFSLSFVVIMGQELDWFRSNLIIALTAIGLPLLLFFILWEIHTPEPLLELSLLKRTAFSFALFNLSILFSAYFGMVILLSLWLKLWVNYTPNWIAILLAIMALTGLFPVFLIDKRIARIDNRIFLALAILLLAISCFHTMVFNVDINFGRIAVSRLLAGLGLALFLAPLFRLSFHAVSNSNLPNVLNLFQITRALSSGLGASIYDCIWLRRQAFFHDRLGSNLTENSAETLEFFAKANAIGLHGDRADAQLEYYLQRQATALALDDCFYLMAWILIGLLITFLFTFLTKPGTFVTVETEAMP